MLYYYNAPLLNVIKCVSRIYVMCFSYRVSRIVSLILFLVFVLCVSRIVSRICVMCFSYCFSYLCYVFLVLFLVFVLCVSRIVSCSSYCSSYRVPRIVFLLLFLVLYRVSRIVSCFSYCFCYRVPPIVSVIVFLLLFLLSCSSYCFVTITNTQSNRSGLHHLVNIPMNHINIRYPRLPSSHYCGPVSYNSLGHGLLD